MLEKNFNFNILRERRVLFLGIGGGSDAISAYICQEIFSEVITKGGYGNTKLSCDEDVQMISKHIGFITECNVPLSTVRHGTTSIDRSLPRGAYHSPLIFVLDKSQDDIIETLTAEINALHDIDFIVAVDTGGDALKTKGASKSRDVMMLKAIAASKFESVLLVLGMASDGISPKKLKPRLKKLQENSYLGCFSLLPYQNLLAECSRGLSAKRTPQIMLSAMRSSFETVLVPRGGNHMVDREWLIHGFAFDSHGVLRDMPTP